jgi:HAD superfamily hydrolase (TIGR01509 family)
VSRAPRAVLFDFGGTLYDYDTLLPGDRESLFFLAGLCGIDAEEDIVYRAYRTVLRRVFREFLPRPFYRHVDMFREAAAGMVRELGGEPDAAALERYRERQWQLHRRDFRLREGVVETLEEIRRRGLGLGVVSNIDADQLLNLRELAGLDRHFDWLLSSEEAGSCKPDARIFSEALRRAGCAPDEALFVGDSVPQDIAGANRAGLHSVLIWHRGDREPPSDADGPRHVIRRIPDLLEILDVVDVVE